MAAVLIRTLVQHLLDASDLGEARQTLEDCARVFREAGYEQELPHILTAAAAELRARAADPLYGADAQRLNELVDLLEQDGTPPGSA